MYQRIVKIAGIVVGIVGISAGIVEIFQYFETRQPIDISGEWEITNTIDSTSYSKYCGLRLHYKVFIIQLGPEFTATGEKWRENDVLVSSTQKSPIRIQGTIDGDRVLAIFTEEGELRTTTGSFEWIVGSNHNVMSGTFKHTAASSSGRTICERKKDY